MLLANSGEGGAYRKSSVCPRVVKTLTQGYRVGVIDGIREGRMMVTRLNLWSKKHPLFLLEMHLWLGHVHFFGKIRKWIGTLVFVQRHISDNPVGKDRNLVGKSPNRIVIGPGDEKVDVLKQNRNLDNHLYNLKDNQEEEGVKETDRNFFAR
jgi:hypothetical protein